MPIKRLLERYIGFDVIVDNDANAAAIGERWSGHGRTVSDFAFLYMGTGIGGAMFLSNHIYRGVSLERRRVRPHRGRAESAPRVIAGTAVAWKRCAARRPSSETSGPNWP